MTHGDFTLSANGTIVLACDDAVRAIDALTKDGMRLERWEGIVVTATGARMKSLEHGGSFALSADGARAAQSAVEGIRRAQATWDRRPEFERATLHVALTFGR